MMLEDRVVGGGRGRSRQFSSDMSSERIFDKKPMESCVASRLIASFCFDGCGFIEEVNVSFLLRIFFWRASLLFSRCTARACACYSSEPESFVLGGHEL